MFPLPSIPVLSAELYMANWYSGCRGALRHHEVLTDVSSIAGLRLRAVPGGCETMDPDNATPRTTRAV